MKISVIVTAYQRRQYILKALQSLEEQNISKDKYEVIIVKDFEDKDIDSIIGSFGYKSILMLSESTLGEFIYSGIVNSEGEIICFLDDDDIFSMEKLSLIYEKFSGNNVSLIKNNIFFIDTSENPIKEDKLKIASQIGMRLPIIRDAVIAPSQFRKRLGYLSDRGVDFNLSSMSILRGIMKEGDLKYLRESVDISPDTFFFLLALKSDKSILVLKNKLTGFRIHKSSISRKIGNDIESARSRIDIMEHLVHQYCGFIQYFGWDYSEHIQARVYKQRIGILREIKKYGFNDIKSRVSLLEALKFAFKNKEIILILMIIYISLPISEGMNS
ncbi:MAG: glycosyltransferase family 2 protein [Thermoplasmatales archaeon]|nr:glycosyltransferase family 2 protein [Thermoplasmatales archaeon]MCW6170300.1 glycosyltransferase family 2 protein [Thermoplasmatales archaeon]